MNRSLAALCCLMSLALAHPATGGSERTDRDAGFLGVIVSREEVGLEPAIEGRLLEIAVRIGDQVESGTLVARLDGRPIREELSRARAELEEARALLLEATTRVSIANETLDQRRRLADQAIIAGEQLREAEQGKELAEAGLERAQAKVKQQEALVRQLEYKLGQCRILAPFAGTVAARYGNPGTIVGPGTAVVRLIGGEGLWVRFAAPVGDAHGLKVGAAVRARLSSLELTLDGTIEQVGSEVDPASGMIICEAAVERPAEWDGSPLPGQAVRVRLADREP